ncbi:hypothetical protein RHGRI_031508 [Rhododendron griersonianum]|uniref:Peptidase A1 domain-containing protein n=1 Tax=Rhododendron griersonianum TaxID=479676 RepID=A0AAV6I845_9ERIC|nr:hypothetical protein RHGRI_031508 [Rhododendron griersonianum]
MGEVSALMHCELSLLLLITIFLFSWFSVTTTNTTAAATFVKPPRVSMKLIHRDSILSPYYNPAATISERFWRDVNSSMARYAYLKARTNSAFATSDDDVRGGLSEHHNVMLLVNFSIGQPPVPQLAVMDSASDLLWIQCSPCKKCFKQLSPMFDPSKSSTYRNLPCNSLYCPVNQKCDSVRTCEYHRKYVDTTSTRGTLGIEELRFMTSDGGTSGVSDVVFGCGVENHAITEVANGILGLSPQKESLVSQMGSSQFSYCIGNLDDPHYEYNHLIIGDGAKIEGYSTPLEVFDNTYYLTLEGISVGDKQLDIDPKIFRRSASGDGGVFIDSGTAATFLTRAGYDPLRAEVRSLIGTILRKAIIQDLPDMLCYVGEVSRDLKGFPVVTFHFAGGADLVLDAYAMFLQQREDYFCMFVRPTTFRESTVIGIRAQQYYNIAYDLDGMNLYFQRIDCELLED